MTLSRFILPLLGEYVDSGYRTPKDRVLYSLRSNGRYQLVVLLCGIVGLGYVLWQNGFQGTSVKALVMALAYCWGLILAIYLMGHGLVAVPRRLYRNARISERLRMIESQAPKLNDRLADATSDLGELEAQIAKLVQRKNGISRDHQEWVDELSEISNMPLPSSGSGANNAAIPAVITDRYLAELSRKLNRARHKRVRYTDTWGRLIQEATDMQAILDASASKHLEFGRLSPNASWLERATILTPYTRYLLHSKVIPAARLGLAAALSLASVCIVWSELVKYPAPKLSIISLTVVSHRSTGGEEVGFVGQVTASLWLLYMCLAALASFDEIKIWGNRALVRRNTYGESATWYSGQIAKLTVPLAYNFVTFLPRGVHQETTFYNFLGRLINLTPLGKGFDYFFPIFILIPVCATLFNLYGRVKIVVGYGIVEDDEDNRSAFDGGGWREGRDLIERELNGTSRLGLSTRVGGRSSSPPSGYDGPARAGRRLGYMPTLPNAPPAIPNLHHSPSEQTEMARRPAQRLADATQAAEEEDENVFQGFAHRVRNTFDTLDRPKWLSDLGRRPKWMGGGVDGNGESSGRADSGRGLGRWFGGRPADGHLRL